MPFHGSGLYPVATAEYLVSIGVIQAASITNGLTASYHLDPAELGGARSVIAEALGRVSPDTRDKFKKDVYLRHIGLMGCVMRQQITVVTSRLAADVPSQDVIYQHRDDSYRLAYVTELLGNRTWFPMSLIALWGEQVAVAKM